MLAGIRAGLQTEAIGENWDDTDSRDLLSPLYRVEEAVASVLFVAMFVSVIAAVIWRFLFTPLLWTLSAAMIGFIWVTLMGASVPNANDQHIQFDPFYNMMPPRLQRWFRVVGNALIVATFALALPSMIDYVGSVGSVPVVGLPISLTPAFAAVVWFLVATVVHRGWRLVADIRGLFEPELEPQEPVAAVVEVL